MSVTSMVPVPKSLSTYKVFSNSPCIHYQLTPADLIQQTIDLKQGTLSDTGALVINTGEFSGRSPDDKFIVKDDITRDTVNWNNFNIPIEPHYFDQLYGKMMAYLESKEIWIRDCYACADPAYRLNIRAINENPWSNLFAYNMFLRPTDEELVNFSPDWQLIQAPGFFC